MTVGAAILALPSTTTDAVKWINGGKRKRRHLSAGDTFCNEFTSLSKIPRQP